MRLGWRVFVGSVIFIITTVLYFLFFAPEASFTIRGSPLALISGGIRNSSLRESVQRSSSDSSAPLMRPSAYNQSSGVIAHLDNDVIASLQEGVEALPVSPISASQKAHLFNSTNITDDLKVTFQSHVNDTKVILVTYYRGGSSFLGELFNQNLQAFYWFEPFRALVKKAGNLTGKITRSSLIGETQLSLKDEALRDLVVDTMRILLSCRVHEDVTGIIHDSFIFRSIKSSQYKECVKRAHPLSGIHGNVVRNCSDTLVDQCEKSRLKVLKVIRIPLDVVEYLWELDPSIYFIHYIRDPRGIMLSRDSIHHYKGVNQSKSAHAACAGMSNNLRLSQILKAKHPEKFLELTYEELASNWLNTTKRIYHFLGLTAPRHVLKWLDLNTHSSRDRHTYSTSRNSLETVNKWQTKIKASYKRIIDSECTDVIHNLGYVK